MSNELITVLMLLWDVSGRKEEYGNHFVLSQNMSHCSRTRRNLRKPEVLSNQNRPLYLTIFTALRQLPTP